MFPICSRRQPYKHHANRDSSTRYILSCIIYFKYVLLYCYKLYILHVICYIFGSFYPGMGPQVYFQSERRTAQVHISYITHTYLRQHIYSNGYDYSI